MQIQNINDLPDLLAKNLISQKEAVNHIASFVIQNYPVFSLEKYDEDFRSEIIVRTLEKGHLILSQYDKSQGSFFNFLFCTVKSFIRSELKNISRKNINEKIFQEASILSFNEKLKGNEKITHKISEIQKIPYNSKSANPENLRKTFSVLKNFEDRANFVLALKSAFYLDDEIISQFCKTYNLKKTEFTDIIQTCRISRITKIERNETNIARRNAAYFFHKRYEKQIENFDSEESTRYGSTVTERNKSQQKRWKTHNYKLKSPSGYIRTSNKVIAEILNIAERQVAYYMVKTLKNPPQINEKHLEEKEETED